MIVMLDETCDGRSGMSGRRGDDGRADVVERGQQRVPMRTASGEIASCW